MLKEMLSGESCNWSQYFICILFWFYLLEFASLFTDDSVSVNEDALELDQVYNPVAVSSVVNGDKEQHNYVSDHDIL